MSDCVVQDWLKDLTLKQQTVLLSAIRGCDGVAKEDISKKFVRVYRSLILKDAYPTKKVGTFMNDVILSKEVVDFGKQLDHYPMHWLMHFIHAIEIVGYEHPEQAIRQNWRFIYFHIVNSLHMNPETQEEMRERLQDGKPSNC
jgi:hypothetical protein